MNLDLHPAKNTLDAVIIASPPNRDAAGIVPQGIEHVKNKAEGIRYGIQNPTMAYTYPIPSLYPGNGIYTVAAVLPRSQDLHDGGKAQFWKTEGMQHRQRALQRILKTHGEQGFLFSYRDTWSAQPTGMNLSQLGTQPSSLRFH